MKKELDMPLKLEEVAANYGYTVEQLLRLGALGKLNIASYFSMCGRKVSAWPENTTEQTVFFDGFII